MWIKEYLACIKNNLFIIIQVCLALAFINMWVGYFAEMAGRLSGIEDTDKDTYFFQYAMAARGLFNIEEGDYAEAYEKIKALPGVEDIGEIFDSPISLGEDSEEKRNSDEIFQFKALDSVSTAAVTYRMKEGRWLNESDRDEEEIHAVLGGAIAEKYGIGDSILIDLDYGVKFEVKVIGILPQGCLTLDMHTLMAGQDAYAFMQPGDNNILVNHKEVLRALKEEGFSDVNAHCIVKLNDNADREYLSDYGKIVSFEEMKQETEKQRHDFMKESIESNVLWAVAIIFGIIATSYMVGKKRRYAWGIYLLLGEKPERLLKMQMFHNIVNYIVGAALSLWIFQKFLMDETFSTDVGRYHIMVDAFFILVMVVVSLLSNAYIMKLEPKEILTQVKE